MTTALAMAIDALSDPAVALADALRRLLVVSRRIDAEDFTSWVRGELNGFAQDDDLPSYRTGEGLPIMLRFDGPLGSSTTRLISPSELPYDLSSVMEDVGLRAPVAELESLADGDSDPSMQLSDGWLEQYRNLAARGEVSRMELMVLNHAAVSIPRSRLRGIIDRVKSTALDLALSLEDISPETGDAGGPTIVDEPRLAHQIQIHLTQIYATGSTITIGDNATVASAEGATAVRIEAGDIDGLLDAAATLLGPESVRALADALDADGSEPADATRGFLEKVKSGAVRLAGGVTTNAAYDGLVALLRQVFPDALG
ncbi:MAG: AbiTii domain-containing protein [Acidimicrobiales bacterium]